ncbi:uncharacterized protein [Eurosta solidaginis]|uniref:uncharacterized protein n=1 Tax=Eurosta solidaginis TaxID=178769 RepID=UPI0035317185
MPESDVTKMKVADLKRELKLRGLATTGNKTELQDRLQTALLDGDISLEDSAITNEDALLDDDAALTDEEDTPIAADENELLKSPTSTPTASELASPLNEVKASVADATDAVAVKTVAASPKKIILKRKTSYTSDDGGKTAAAGEVGTGASATTKENTEPPKEKVLKMSERNPITVVDLTNETDGGKKIVQLTQMERLELRAKKFGISKNTATTTPTATGPATPATVKPKVNAKISDIGGGAIIDDAKQIEILKKRAERFGCVVSSKMAQIDAAEKLQKRKERFGAGNGTTVVVSPVSGVGVTKGSDVWAEKARARLERFKNTPTLPTTTITTGKKVDISATGGGDVGSELAEDVDAKKESTTIVTTAAAPPASSASPPASVAGN